MEGGLLRKRFLGYFEERGHLIRPSASLVPTTDPTLLFTSAGMVPFKPYFLGKEVPFARAASCQRCFRTTDIDQVGKTSRHHTLFEMLGNFSFGDYFKEEAILLAWEFITKELGIPKDRLWISIYKDDDEAFGIWKRMGVDSRRIVRFGDEDNFWKMGPTGPCGPCSEIIYDQGEGVGCGRKGCGVGCGCDRFLELWNLVFTQFDRQEDGRLNLLPRPNIDTGMGLERLACIMQGRRNNFETDLIWPIIERIEDLSGLRYGEDMERDVAFKIVADHIRGIVLLIHDRVYPENVGRGYVLRNILRRASWKGRHYLGFDRPFLYKLVPATVKIFQEVDGLIEEREYISRIIYMEEERFINTLNLGEPLLNQRIAKTIKVIDGKDAFELYDTYGLPIEMIQEVAGKRGLVVDMEGFREMMRVQQERSRRGGPQFKGEIQVHRAKETDFVGYTRLRSRSKVVAIFKGDLEVDGAKQGEEIGIVLDRTPFYPEQGGQLGDTGMMKRGKVRIKVHDTKLTQMGHIHMATILNGSLGKGDTLLVEVDHGRRRAIERSHTTTHLLHSILRTLLGQHVKQAGSLVGQDQLRFDFTHPSPLDQREVRRVEELLNRMVLENMKVKTYYTTLDDAKREGAIALFEQEYGEIVRVVKVGDVSLELCGGTHIRRTGEIGLVRLLTETGVASGVRRIEALTGEAAYRYVLGIDEMVEELTSVLKTSRDGVLEKVDSILSENRGLAKKVEALNLRLIMRDIDAILSSHHLIKGVKVIIKRMGQMEMKSLRDTADLLMDRLKSGVVILVSEERNKVNWVMKVTHDLTDRLDAGDIIDKIAKITGGGGGGRKDFGQAGGKDLKRVDKALEDGLRLIMERLG